MNAIYFITALVILIFLIAIQLIRMTSYVIRIQKDASLSTKKIKEDTSWEFIKGLY